MPYILSKLRMSNSIAPRMRSFIYLFYLFYTMVTDRSWWIINISMGLLCIILVLMLIGITLPNVGQAISVFDSSEPLCIIQVGKEQAQWDDLPRCCLEAQAQLECVHEPQQFEEGSTDFSCRSSSQVQYLLNNKALSYCQKQVFWRK